MIQKKRILLTNSFRIFRIRDYLKKYILKITSLSILKIRENIFKIFIVKGFQWISHAQFILRSNEDKLVIGVYFRYQLLSN